jgi:hypothetical protein
MRSVIPESRVGKNDCKISMVRLTASPKATVSQIALLVLRIAAKYAEKKKPSGTKPKMLIPTSLQ